jgi:hypothetical protein
VAGVWWSIPQEFLAIFIAGWTDITLLQQFLINPAYVLPLTI